MTNDLDALLTALHVKIDDGIGGARWLGCPPQLSDSELVCLAVAQAVLGFASESRWLRFVSSRLVSMFPYVPKQPGWNKRLRAALPLVKRAIRLLATDTDFWFDNHLLIDSTPVECARSRPTVKRSDLADWAGYGYCASHSRFFWGLRLYLVCTPGPRLRRDGYFPVLRKQVGGPTPPIRRSDGPGISGPDDDGPRRTVGHYGGTPGGSFATADG